MRIIDNNKDYYDYLSGIYGEDPLAVYDRRGSVTWPQYKHMFTVFYDEKRTHLDEYVSRTYESWRLSGNQYFLCLEVGRKQYIIKTHRLLEKPNSKVVKLERSIFGVREVRNKHARSPLALFECSYGSFPYVRAENFDPRDVRYWSGAYTETVVDNPILKDSFLARIISADEIWHALYEYIMSLNDKEIVDNRTDSMKLESAGFDAKTSFRKVK